MNQELFQLYTKVSNGSVTDGELRRIEQLESLETRDLADETTRELRCYEPGLEVRAADTAKLPGSIGIIWGRPAKFGVLSRDLGGFKENICKGCFTRSLAANDDLHDVRALMGHQKTEVLGRRSAGTLEIGEDAQGLFVAIHCIDTTAGRDALLNIKHRNLDAMSFGFKPKAVSWRREAGQIVRDLKDVDLAEVSVVTWAQYPNTELAARDLKTFRDGPGNQQRTPISLLRRRQAFLNIQH